MIKKNIATNEFGFIFNPSTGDSFSSNPIAAEIIQLMKENKSVNDIKKILLDKYETDKMTIEKDVDEFVGALKENNLLNK
ncbi:MAG: PqqD family protein [Sphingobacteriales bacterium]|nr:PqqD family protein [Sphingobacteriales bacterium]